MDTSSGTPARPNPTTAQALAVSLLAGFPPAARERLLADAVPVTLPAGSTIYHDDDDPRCVLVVSGLVRVYVSAPDGRTVTIRYARSGEMLGVPAIAGGPMPVSVRMLAEAELLFLNARTLQALGETEPGIGWLLAREVATRLAETIEAFSDNAFGSLRQRVARHLLDLATTD